MKARAFARKGIESAGMNEQRIVFHHPRPLIENGSSGSEVRPCRMVCAFENVGFRVEGVFGAAAQRKAEIQRLRQAVRRGERFAFVYAESSTMPTVLTERHHLPLHPFLDFGFIRFLKQKGIPIALYYRDIHWRFPHYRSKVNRYKRLVANTFYYYDWCWYRKIVDHLFLPSLAMAKALPFPWPPESLGALPPGCNVIVNDETDSDRNNESLNLCYVGGVIPPLYDLSEMFEVVQSLDKVNLNLCCRRDEWEIVRSRYLRDGSENVHVVHLGEKELSDFYLKADVFLLFWRPYAYLSFAMPVKLFETMGHGVPVITIEGTEAARFVAEEDIGWVVADKRELRNLIERLRLDRDLLRQKRERVRVRREKHSWAARAEQVSKVMSELSKERR